MSPCDCLQGVGCETEDCHTHRSDPRIRRTNPRTVVLPRGLSVNDLLNLTTSSAIHMKSTAATIHTTMKHSRYTASIVESMLKYGPV